MHIKGNSEVLRGPDSESIKEAQLLLTYASQEGLDINKEVIDIIVKAKHFVETEKWLPEFESQFWMAFKKISKLVSPVSVASLKAIYEPVEKESSLIPVLSKKKKKKTLVRKTIRFYKSMVLVSIIFMIITQIYWFIGSSMLKKINTLPKEMEEITLQQQEREDDIKNAADDKKIMMLEAKLLEKGHALKAGIYILSIWNKVGEFFPNVAIKLYKAIARGNSEAENSNQNELQVEISNHKIIITSHFILEAVQSYLLPLLYGLLGALAYVLRALVSDIKQHTFTAEGRTNYGLRVFLGMFAGLTINWICAQTEIESTLSIKSLSPLALAFLAGYSVELLFSALDYMISSLIKKLSKKTDSNKKKKSK